MCLKGARASHGNGSIFAAEKQKDLPGRLGERDIGKLIVLVIIVFLFYSYFFHNVLQVCVTSQCSSQDLRELIATGAGFNRFALSKD